MPSSFGGVLKNGWHPEKGGSSGSSGSSGGTRSKISGQVKGMVGRGDDNAKARERAENHVSRPLNDLTDPDSFAPPPKRTGTGLAPAPTASTSQRKVITAPSKYQDPHGPRVDAPQKISHDHELEAAEASAPPVKRGAYRTNTTGYTTDNLPLPPTRRDSANSQPRAITNGPAGGSGGGAQRALPSTQAPSLPPRLPPRGAAGGSPTASASPQSTGNSGTLNKGAVNRLGASGVSVPGFGIGQQQQSGNSGNNAQNQPSAPPPAQQPGHLGELQNRFSKMRTSEQGQAQPQPQRDGQSQQGTTWAQKQAAIKTASQFHKDPSSVSFADAKSAAGTANNFRERHGEQVASGMRTANNVNQKYGVADKVGAFSQRAQGQQTQQPVHAPQQSGIAGKKKPPPPPPPKKKPELSAMQPAQGEDAPPPIPTSTRPTF